MKEKLITFFKHLNRFGFIKGITLYSRNHVFGASDAVIRLNGLPHPFELRKNTSDRETFDQVFLLNEYDYKLNFTPAFIIDCGANIGLASLFFQSKFPEAAIVAVEPELSNYSQLVKNTEKYSNITTIRSGIWKKNAFLKVEDIHNFGNWGFVCTEVETETADTITAVSIGDIMRQFNKTEIDLLKIDIEGAELEVFSENYESWLPKTKVIMIELHDAYRKGTSKPFFTALMKYDFSVFHRGENIVCIRN